MLVVFVAVVREEGGKGGEEGVADKDAAKDVGRPVDAGDGAADDVKEGEKNEKCVKESFVFELEVAGD